jgi:hypothetical protein
LCAHQITDSNRITFCEFLICLDKNKVDRNKGNPGAIALINPMSSGQGGIGGPAVIAMTGALIAGQGRSKKGRGSEIAPIIKRAPATGQAVRRTETERSAGENRGR